MERTALNLTAQQPHGFLKFLLRAPIWLYRSGLGNWLGDRFLLLTHTGRKSGRARHAALEIVALEPEIGAYYVAAGWRGKADWFQNIQANASVWVTVGVRTFKATAQILPVEEAVAILHVYAFCHPGPFRLLARFLIGKKLYPDLDGCSHLAQAVPVIRLLPE